MIASAAVHTVGINWASVATIATAVIVIMTTVTAYFGRQITSAVNGLGDRLEAKLETKETVSRLDRRLTVVETEIRRTGP